MNNIFTIAKRELAYFINTPVAYIVTVAFLVPSFFLYWRQTLISNDASLRSFFSLLPWFLLLVIPALTMRALAEERRKNTVELLLAHPIKGGEIVIGKFLGVWCFYLIILGIIAGVLSLVIAAPIVSLASPYLSAFMPDVSLSNYFYGNLSKLLGYQLMFGMLLGSVSSVIAVRRYLKI